MVSEKTRYDICMSKIQVNFPWRSEVKWNEVAQSCPALCDPMDCSPPGSSIHEILQARILEWVAISFSRGSSWPRDQTRVSCILSRCFTIWATREAHRMTLFPLCLILQILRWHSWLKKKKIHLPTQEDARDAGSINGSGSSPGVENGNQLHYSCLESAMDRGAYLWTGLDCKELNTTKHGQKQFTLMCTNCLR